MAETLRPREDVVQEHSSLPGPGSGENNAPKVAPEDPAKVQAQIKGLKASLAEGTDTFVTGLKGADVGEILNKDTIAAENKVKAEAGLDETVNKIIANQEKQRAIQESTRKIADNIAKAEAEKVRRQAEAVQQEQQRLAQQAEADRLAEEARAMKENVDRAKERAEVGKAVAKSEAEKQPTPVGVVQEESDIAKAMKEADKRNRQTVTNPEVAPQNNSNPLRDEMIRAVEKANKPKAEKQPVAIANKAETPNQEVQPDQEKSFVRRAGEFARPVVGGVKSRAEGLAEAYKIGKGWAKGFREWRTERAERRAQEAKEAEQVAQNGAKAEQAVVEGKTNAAESIDLHDIQKQLEALRSEMKKIIGEGSKEDIIEETSEANAEMSELLEERQSLAEKVTGKNIAEIMVTAEKRVAETLGDGMYNTREEYVRAHLSREQNVLTIAKETDLLNTEWKNLSESQQKKYGNNFELFRTKTYQKAQKNGFSEDEFYGLMAAGYKPQSLKRKGFLNIGRSISNVLTLRLGRFGRSERRIVGPDGKKVWMRTKDFNKMAELEGKKFKNGIANEAQNRLGEQWGAAVKNETEDSLERIANDKNAAIERAKSPFEQGKKAMLVEILSGLSEQLANPSKLKSREKSFGGKMDSEINAWSMFEGIGGFGDLNGDPRKNARILKDGVSELGVGAKDTKNMAEKGRNNFVSEIVTLLLKLAKNF
jgi:hypothetical protein